MPLVNDLPKLIPELQDVPEIRTFQDILKVRDFVFSTVPWFKEPTDLRMNFHTNNVLNLYWDFKQYKAGGWCGLNATFFDLLMYWYGIRTRPYNYGVSFYGLTHIGIIVEYDGIEFFMDPYFAAHYVHRDGFPLPFRDLMNLIQDRKFDRFCSEYSSDARKLVLEEDGTYTQWSPEEMVEMAFVGSPNYKKTLTRIFGVDDPRILMLIKI
jgi:hypothetical protein